LIVLRKGIVEEEKNPVTINSDYFEAQYISSFRPHEFKPIFPI